MQQRTKGRWGQDGWELSEPNPLLPGPRNQMPLPLFLHLEPESVMTAVTSEGYLEELARHS